MAPNGGAREPPPFPWPRFDDFIAPGADRRALLRELFGEGGLSYQEIPLAGNSHFFVSSGEGGPPPVILTAHYDRVPGSPGANDNSAAVFQLLETAKKLRENRTPPWLMIFTDKEELRKGETYTDQGSFALARGLRQVGLGAARIFSFDACGAGDTLIISTTAEELLKKEGGPGIENARRRVGELRARALKTARKAGLDRVLLLPTPFSDDAGFLRGGLAAQTITVLPREEASHFAALVRQRPGAGLSILSVGGERRELPVIPRTWRTLNGPEDRPERLTPRHYAQVIRFAAALCGP